MCTITNTHTHAHTRMHRVLMKRSKERIVTISTDAAKTTTSDEAPCRLHVLHLGDGFADLLSLLIGNVSVLEL